MVTTPEQWPWSSYRAMTGQAPIPKWLAVDGLLSQFGVDREEARRSYQQFVSDGVGRGIWDGLRQQIYLGSEAFVERMQAKESSKYNFPVLLALSSVFGVAATVT